MSDTNGGHWIDLRAADGHAFKGFLAPARGVERGRVVVVQEIFGVNSHIRSVCAAYAAEGFTTLAPASFDRVERGVELGYDEAGIARGRALMRQLSFDDALADVRAALDHLGGGAAVMGYCWGGSVAWLAASRLPVAAAVCYYGGQIATFMDAAPKVPVLPHFGEKDHAIPLTVAEGVRERYPTAITQLYPAGHGFNCDQRASYDAPSAALAKRRTLGFLDAVF